MKCPHCNQAHRDDTIFCPNTGKRIFDSDSNQSKKQPKWSSLYDFEKGDIIIDGVVLGKTTLKELRQRDFEIDTIDFETRKESNCYTFYLGESSMITGIISRLTYRDLEKSCQRYKNPSAFNKDAALEKYNIVVEFALNIWDEGCPLISVIGIEDKSEDEDNFEFDYNEITDILEEHGYMRIENYMVREMDDCRMFVHDSPNSNGDYVFVTLDSEQEMIFFSVNEVTEWASYRTGRIFRVK